MTTLFLFIIGLILVVDGSNIFVRAAVTLAQNMRVSKVLVGGSILAIGTSLPELFVALASAIESGGELGLGNIIGSNIANVFLILALTLSVHRLKPESADVRLLTNILLVATLIFLGLLSSGFVWYYGIGFLALAGYLVYQQSRVQPEPETRKYSKEYGNVFLTVMGAVALAGMLYGSDLLVDMASELAAGFGISDFIIGLVLVSIGTSLPELATAIAALRQKESEVALSGIIGSNIYNIILVGGASGMIAGYVWVGDIFTELMFALSGILLFFFVRYYAKSGIPRWWGAALLIMYAAYLGFITYQHLGLL